MYSWQCLIDAMDCVDDEPDHAKSLLAAYEAWRANGGLNPVIPAARSGLGADVTGDRLVEYIEMALEMYPNLSV